LLYVIKGWIKLAIDTSDIGFLLFGLAIGLGTGLANADGTAKAVLVALVGGGGLLGGLYSYSLSRSKNALSLFSVGLIVGFIAGAYFRTTGILPPLTV